MSPPGPPLRQLPAPHLPGLLRHLRPDGSVCAGQRSGGRPDEAPGRQQQRGAAGRAGGAGGEGGEGEGAGGPSTQHRFSRSRPGARRGRTCPGNTPPVRGEWSKGGYNDDPVCV